MVQIGLILRFMLKDKIHETNKLLSHLNALPQAWSDSRVSHFVSPMNRFLSEIDNHKGISTKKVYDRQADSRHNIHDKLKRGGGTNSPDHTIPRLKGLKPSFGSPFVKLAQRFQNAAECRSCKQ